jgi:hypothetical protein
MSEWAHAGSASGLQASAVQSTQDTLWRTSVNPSELLAMLQVGCWSETTAHPYRWARYCLSPRKLRLFALGVIRSVWPLAHLGGETATPPAVLSYLLVAERLANGRVSSRERALLYNRADTLPFLARSLAQMALRADPGMAARDACTMTVSHQSAAPGTFGPSGFASYACDTLREVAGNPFCPVKVDSRWIPGVARRVLLGARQEGRYELDAAALAVAADALEEAGCDQPLLLAHLRSESRCPGVTVVAGARIPHVPGCWAVDRVLGLE